MEKFSICVLGDLGVGKTTVCQTLSQDAPTELSPLNIFLSMYHSSPIEWWDFSGHSKFSTLRKLFYKFFSGYILVFDMSNKKSFNNLELWEAEIKSWAEATSSPIMIVGTKSDLSCDGSFNKEFTVVSNGKYDQDEWDKFFSRVLSTDLSDFKSLNENLYEENTQKSGVISRVLQFFKPVELPLNNKLRNIY